jgi:hypothetical protein
MPFQMASSARAKRVAKDIRAFLDARGDKPSLQRARDLAAIVFGYGSYAALERALRDGSADPDDDQLDQRARDERRDGQVTSPRS